MLLNYYQHGNGKETIVLLHSGGETAMSENQILRDFLCKDNKVISLDLRGHGKSISNDLDDYFNKCAGDVLETLNSLAIERFHVIGASIGALVALFIYEQWASRIISLMLSGITMNRPENWLEITKEEDMRLKEIIEMDEVISYMNEIHEGNWRELLTHNIGVDWYPFRQTKRLQDINTPTLICIGEQAENELESIKTYRENKNIHIAVIPFSGHLVSEMQPEIYTKIVQEFLSKQPK